MDRLQLPGTIHTAVEEINEIGERNGTGAKGFAIQLDVRDADAVENAINSTADRFGGLDIVVNNVRTADLAVQLTFETVQDADLPCCCLFCSRKGFRNQPGADRESDGQEREYPPGRMTKEETL